MKLNSNVPEHLATPNPSSLSVFDTKTIPQGKLSKPKFCITIYLVVLFCFSFLRGITVPKPFHILTTWISHSQIWKPTISEPTCWCHHKLEFICRDQNTSPWSNPKFLTLVNATYHVPDHHYHDEYKLSKLYMAEVIKSMSIWHKSDWQIYQYVIHW